MDIKKSNVGRESHVNKNNSNIKTSRSSIKSRKNSEKMNSETEELSRNHKISQQHNDKKSTKDNSVSDQVTKKSHHLNSESTNKKIKKKVKKKVQY